jgi:hypothetical protein
LIEFITNSLHNSLLVLFALIYFPKVLAAQLAKKWGLLPAGGSAGGCAVMFLLSANPQHLHIFAQLPLPITAAEKKAIAEAQVPQKPNYL